MSALQYQEEARCFGCCERISPADLVFGTLCGHVTCPSLTWHYHHFMQAREVWEKAPKENCGGERAIAHLLFALRGDRDGGGERC